MEVTISGKWSAMEDVTRGLVAAHMCATNILSGYPAVEHARFGEKDYHQCSRCKRKVPVAVLVEYRRMRVGFLERSGSPLRS